MLDKNLSKDSKNIAQTNEDLLNAFRNKFLMKPASAKKVEVSSNKNPFNISIEKYSQPKISKQTEEKIKRLAHITTSIKNRVISVNEDYEDKNFKLDYQKALNSAQFTAATTINGTILVIAGAGSGKTRTIIYRVAYLIENEINPTNILLLTFTRKAANEMLDRATQLLGDAKCGNILSGTFHSFANYILRRYYKILNIQPNFTIIDSGDAEDILDLIRQEMKFDKKQKAFPKKNRIQAIISKGRNCNIPIEKVIEKEYKGLTDFTEEIKIIAQAFYEYKQVNNILDYDDLMEFLRDSLKNNEEFRNKIQEQYKYLMVDEFQDTNPIQKDIIDLIADKYKNLMIVGDDAQSIYGFRGADVENILVFPETYPECKVIKIEQNYRSSQDILNFTNSIIDNTKIGYKKTLFSNITKSGKPNISKFFSQDDEAEFIVDQILKLREENVPLNQIAILYRASYHSNFIQAELTKRSIPYIVYGGIRFTERRHVKDVISYLRVMFNPYDSVSWNRVLKLVPNIGSSAASKIVNSLQQNNGQINLQEFKSKKFAQDLENLVLLISDAGKDEISIPEKIERVKEFYTPILNSMDDDADIRILDVDVIYSLACKYNELEKFLSDFALEPPSNKYQDKNTPLVDETEEKPVVLSTIHSAKGLEWNTVFVPHLLDGIFPGTAALNKIEEIEEERRLFYVACTRAKEKLYLTLPSQVSSWDAFFTLPSRFIIETDINTYNFIK